MRSSPIDTCTGRPPGGRAFETDCSTVGASEIGWIRILAFPSSSWLRSRRSLTSVDIRLPCRTIAARPSLTASSGILSSPPANSSAKPTMLASGVRSSCAALARNCVFDCSSIRRVSVNVTRSSANPITSACSSSVCISSEPNSNVNGPAITTSSPRPRSCTIGTAIASRPSDSYWNTVARSDSE